MNLTLASMFPGMEIKADKNKTEMEIFSHNFRMYDFKKIKSVITTNVPSLKNVMFSQQQILHGKELILKKNYDEALNFFYMALEFAPFDSEEYAIAINDRSEVLYQLGKYKDCLKDIENVFRANFEEEAHYKVYTRQAWCFLKLKQNFNALESCKLAYAYLVAYKYTINDSQFETAKNILNDIYEQANTTDVEIIEEQQFPKPQLRDEEHPKFLNASNVIDLKYDEKKGRHVMANVNIKPGDVLFVEEAFCTIRINHLLNSFTYCSNCFIYTLVTLPCKHCIIHFYCSEHCRKTAWSQDHRWICIGERSGLLGDAMRLTLKAMIKASRNNFNTDLENESVYGNRKDNFAFVNKLDSNRTKMTDSEVSDFTKLSIWMVMYLKECTDYFEWLKEQPSHRNRSFAELYDIVGGHILKLVMQIHCNSSEIVNAYVDLKLQCLNVNKIALGLYVSSTMVNHSCTPNTIVSFDKTLKVMRATKKIPKNTEITVDYAQFYSGQRITDHTFLIESYKFDCSCAKCSNTVQDEKMPWLCTKCQGKAFNCSETQAKCTNCHFIFNVLKYRSIEQTFGQMFHTKNISSIENINKKMKKIYHKDNILFANYFNLAYDYYSEEGNVPKFLDICKSLVQLCDSYDEIDDFKMNTYLKMMRSTGVYYSFMKLGLFPYDEYAYKEFDLARNKGLNLLKYFVTPNKVQRYKKFIRDYLDPMQSLN